MRADPIGDCEPSPGYVRRRLGLCGGGDDNPKRGMRSRTTFVLAAAAIGAATMAFAESEASAVADDAHPGIAGSSNSPALGWELAQGAGGTRREDRPPSADEADEPPPPPCPGEMVLVEGEHCYQSEQVCLRWDDPEGRPERRVCGLFKEPSRCKSTTHPMRFCIDRDEFVDAGETVPVAGVSWTEAQKRCEALGKRLCTNLEWEFACEGEESVPYPYGFERSPALCNQDRVVRDGERGATGDLREPPHPSCVSPFGVRDMAGNVDEWVTRPYGRAPHRSELRGGWWMTGRNRCRAATSSHDEMYADRQTGFRCCRSAPQTN